MKEIYSQLLFSKTDCLLHMDIEYQSLFQVITGIVCRVRPILVSFFVLKVANHKMGHAVTFGVLLKYIISLGQ